MNQNEYRYLLGYIVAIFVNDYNDSEIQKIVILNESFREDL